MGKRVSLAALAALVFATLVGAGLAAEGKQRRAQKPQRKKPGPISVDDYLAAVGDLNEIAAVLTAPDGAGKLDELRNRAEATLKKLGQSESRIKRALQAADAPALARELKSFAYRSLIGKLSYQRRAVIQSKPELKQEYAQFAERQKQIDKDRLAFYQKLRTASPEIDKLEKAVEQIKAQQEKERRAEAERRKKAREKKKK